jgi:hypothetical protein
MATLRREFGPALPELLAPRLRTTPGRVRAVLLVLAALLLAAFAARKLMQGATSLPHDALVSRPIAFTLGYRDGLEQVATRPGEALRLQTPAGTEEPESFTVAPLELARYSGDEAGVLPIVAARGIAALRREFPSGFRYRGDGRTRVNLLPGHQVSFQTNVAGHTTYGKRFFLLPDEPGARAGVAVTLLSARSPAIASVYDVGGVGLLKSPFRSFRFGTERP